MTPERQRQLEDDFYMWRDGIEGYPTEWGEFLSECTDDEEERAFLESLVGT